MTEHATAHQAGPAFPAHRDLLESAARLEKKRARFTGEEPGQHRAARILGDLAGRCRAAAAALMEDPTLASEPVCSARFRPVDLLAELARQLAPLLVNAELNHVGLDRWPREQRWAEAEALYRRACEFADLIPRTVVRPDHATVAGCQAISRARLAAHAGDVRVAADLLRGALADAMRGLPHPDPQASELAELADILRQHAEQLAAVQAGLPDPLALPGGQRDIPEAR